MLIKYGLKSEFVLSKLTNDYQLVLYLVVITSIGCEEMKQNTIEACVEVHSRRLTARELFSHHGDL